MTRRAFRDHAHVGRTHMRRSKKILCRPKLKLLLKEKLLVSYPEPCFRLTVGDRVKVEMSPYDLDKARIVYRLG